MPMTSVVPRRAGRLDNRGVALPLALLGLVVVSLLVTGALLTSSAEMAISGAHSDATRSLYGADAALEGFLSSRIQAGGASALRPDTTYSYAHSDGNNYDVTVSRLVNQTVGANVNETFSLLCAPAGGRGRTVGALINTSRNAAPINLNINAGASLASDNVTISGSAKLSGRQDDALCSTGADVNAVELASNTTADIKAKNVEGDVVRSTYSKAQFASHILGGKTPEQIADVADKRFGFPGTPVWSGGAPSSSGARTDPLNWGCPIKVVTDCDSVDSDYFPVVAINTSSSVQLSGGHGQGLLIILGDAHLNGGFKYAGVVIIVGDLQVNGHAEIQGALIALGDISLTVPKDGDGESGTINGDALVRYNSCTVADAESALERAQAANSPQAFGAGTYGWFEVVR